MKCLVGVESHDSMVASIRMLKRLAFSDLAVELLHVADMTHLAPGYGAIGAPDVPSELVEAIQKHGEVLLNDGLKMAEGAGFSATKKLNWGPASGVLLEEVRKGSADLIAVHRQSKSILERLFLGSVSRAVAIDAKQSVLITKGEIEESGPISVVLAVDHSPYGDRCLKLFDKFELSGIGRVAVVTALEPRDHPTLQGWKFVYSDESAESDPLTFLRNKNEEICARFRSKGIEATALAFEGNPNKVLANVMHDTSAALIVLGSQGHGFLERLFVGSVALHQVAAEPYSVLLLRV
jgi:nucleotide-binding universal stress UspA family protein